MAAKQQIPEVQGVQDSKVRDILTTMRTIINNITGRSNGQISTLNATANLGGVINKINEIIYTLQEAVNPQSDIPIQSAKSEVRLNTANGYGSTNTKIRRFSNIVTNTGQDITYADNATDGATFTINSNGTYAISYTDNFTGTNTLGISLNSTQLTTNSYQITLFNILALETTAGANLMSCISWEGYLSAGDIIRAHTDGAAVGTSPTLFYIARMKA